MRPRPGSRPPCPRPARPWRPRCSSPPGVRRAPTSPSRRRPTGSRWCRSPGTMGGARRRRSDPDRRGRWGSASPCPRTGWPRRWRPGVGRPALRRSPGGSSRRRSGRGRWSHQNEGRVPAPRPARAPGTRCSPGRCPGPRGVPGTPPRPAAVPDPRRSVRLQAAQCRLARSLLHRSRRRRRSADPPDSPRARETRPRPAARSGESCPRPCLTSGVIASPIRSDTRGGHGGNPGVGGRWQRRASGIVAATEASG